MSCIWQEIVYLFRGDIWNNTCYSIRIDTNFPYTKHLYLPMLLAIVLMFIKNLMERYWLAPVGVLLGIKDRRRKKAPTNEVLETAYSRNRYINHKEILGLATQLDWTQRKVEKWLRKRQNQDKSSTLVKFCGSTWKSLYYTIIIAWGFIVLWYKPWFWDIKECWYTYPYHTIEWSVWCYCMMSLTYYWSECFSHFLYVAKRTDFWPTLIHHLTAIALLSINFLTNLVRLGSLVLLVHYCADVFLQAAKMVRYVGYHKGSNLLFGMFLIVWIITRLSIYPSWIMYNAYVVAPTILMFPGYYTINSLFVILLVLHIFWTHTIVKSFAKAFKQRQPVDDLRSNSSASSDNNDD